MSKIIKIPIERILLDDPYQRTSKARSTLKDRRIVKSMLGEGILQKRNRK